MAPSAFFFADTEWLILQEPGELVGTLALDVSWQAINNHGVAAAVNEADVLVSDGVAAPTTFPMPAEWFPATEIPSIQAISDDGKVLIRRPLAAADPEAYLLDTATGTFTVVKQTGLAGESIIFLSSKNARMLGSGPKPFQVTPDGTPIRLEGLQIKSSSTASAVPLSSLYPNPIVPQHITSDGRITLTTIDALQHQVILQIVPYNDSKGTGMADDWVTSEIAYLVALDPVHWGYLTAAGVLDPNTCYWGDRWTAAQSFALGFSGSNRTLSATRDSDGDGLVDSLDADPLDTVVNWRTTPEPRWALVELPVASTTADFQDVSPKGSVLFDLTDQCSGLSGQLMVDRHMTPHRVDALSFGDTGFVSTTAGVLIDEYMLVFRQVENSSDEYELWDPVGVPGLDFTPYSDFIYPDDILDSPGSFQVKWNYQGVNWRYETPGGILAASDGANRNARVESTGNVVGNPDSGPPSYDYKVGYWTYDSVSATYGNPRYLPGSFSSTDNVSATIKQPRPSFDQINPPPYEWHAVGTADGVHIASENFPFRRSAIGNGQSAFCVGVGSAGWLAAETNQSSVSTQMWCNGSWKDFRDLVGQLGVNRPESIHVRKIRDNGVGVAEVKFTGEQPKFMLMVPVTVEEMSPTLRDENDNLIYGSEIVTPLPESNEMVERDPAHSNLAVASTVRIAWRDMKVRIGQQFVGETVTWSMTAQFIPLHVTTAHPQGTPEDTPRVRGDWNQAANANYRHNFSASEMYGSTYQFVAGVTTGTGPTATTSVDPDGYTAVRVNLPPIGFNKARITLNIDSGGLNIPVDIIDLEVPVVVIIDPGHGGNKDMRASDMNHATSATGILEKDMTLGVSKSLRDNLKDAARASRNSIRVILTRNDDNNLSGMDRANFSGKYGADDFLSVHFNDDKSESTRGSEIWIYPDSAPPTGYTNKYYTCIHQINYQADYDFAGRVLTSAEGVIPRLALYGVAGCEKRHSASGPHDNVNVRKSQPNSPVTDGKYVRESATDHTLPPNIRQSATPSVRVLDGEESDKRAIDQAVKELAATRNEKTVEIWISMMRESEAGLPDVLPSLEELRSLAEQAEKGMLKGIASNPVRFLDVLRPCVIYLTQFDMPEADREVTEFTRRFDSKYGDTPIGKHYSDAYLMEITKAKDDRKAGAVFWKYDRKAPSGID